MSINLQRYSRLIASAIVCVCASNHCAQDRNTIKPTNEQLEAAKKTFASLQVEFKADIYEGNDAQDGVFAAFMRKASDDDLRKIPDLPFSFGLDLSGSEITSAGLKTLANVKNLTKLRLDATRVHELDALANRKNLLILKLSNTSITDAQLKQIAGLTKLVILDLSGTKITDAGLKELANFKDLRSLDLEKTAITDLGVKEIVRLKTLKRLYLERTNVTSAAIKDLAGLKELATLDLTDTRVTDVGLRNLAELAKLEQVWLSGNDITDAGLKELRELSRLENFLTLSLIQTKTTEAAVNELRKAMPKILIAR